MRAFLVAVYALLVGIIGGIIYFVVEIIK